MKFPPGGGRTGIENSKQPFEILYQEDRKPAIVSPADVSAVLKGPARVTSQTRGAANKYAIFCKTDTAGRYTVTVTVRGRFTASHEFTIAGPTDPSKCRVAGNKKVNVGSKYTCKVQLVDNEGNDITCGLDDKLEVGIMGPQGTFENLQSKNNDDGTFSVSLDIKAPNCDFELSLRVNGDEIGASPWKFQS